MMTIANAASSVQRGLAPVRSVLGNGVRVIAKHAGATPAVTLHASFDAGTIFDPPSEPGVSHFVSRTIDLGTAARAADDIAERLENRGVSLAITVNRHALSLVCTCLVEDLDRAGTEVGSEQERAGLVEAHGKSLVHRTSGRVVHCDHGFGGIDAAVPACDCPILGGEQLRTRSRGAAG